MDYLEINSSVIQGISHDPETDTLTIHFHQGRKYTFVGVPENVVEQLIESESPGRFFHQGIKPYYDGWESDE